MTAFYLVAGACCLWVAICWTVLYIWCRRQIVERRCVICDDAITDIDYWRWAEHLDGAVHYDCVPAMIRACGPAYVTLWLEQGDALRTLSSIVESEEVAS